MSKYVDLNSDMGEGFGAYKMGLDSELLNFVTSANIACGWHAGDALIMNKTVQEALSKNVGVGAHPGYPDLLAFGRRKIDVTPEEVAAYMLYQTGALSAFTAAHGGKLQHMKLHGAFYNTVCVTENLAKAVVDALYDFDPNIIVMALSGSLLLDLAEKKGMKVAHEVFADRGYNEDSTLVNRKLPGAMVHDPKIAIERVKRMVLENKVETVTGKVIDIRADSICVHGDNPEAVAFVETIRRELENSGIKVQSLQSFL